MLKIKEYFSHWENFSKSDIDIEEVKNVIITTQVEICKGCTKKLRDEILYQLSHLGWTNKIAIAYNSKISITAIKGSCGLCFQTGNVSRFYADLLKLQYLFINKKITYAIYILPTLHNAKEMGINMVSFERFVNEINLFSEIVTIPIFVLGIN